MTIKVDQGFHDDGELYSINLHTSGNFTYDIKKISNDKVYFILLF